MNDGVDRGAPDDEGQGRPRSGREGRARSFGPRSVLGGLLMVLVLALLPAVPADFWGPVRPSRPAFGNGTARAPTQPPNIVLIQVDDQDVASFTRAVMPNTFRLIADHGTRFTNYIDSGPLCCPSRAVILTGQYGHNNGVMWNVPGYGDLQGKDNTLPVWLQQAGYLTAHVGKYLNLYARYTHDPNAVAPGWDEWDTVLEPPRPGGRFGPHTYYNYTLRQNGRRAIDFGSAPDDYVTRVLNNQAVRVIHRYLPNQRPLFMEVDQMAPHSSTESDPRCQGSAIPDPMDRNLFVDKPLETSPSFNEADVGDKPSYVRATLRLGPAGTATMQRRQNCRDASLAAVDRGVQRVVGALAQEHELANTAIIYTSDNGFLLGQHRLAGKISPYEEDLHVPFATRLPSRFAGPGGAPPTLASTVANVDVAPTILSLAGATPCDAAGNCRVLDGRSLLPAIESDGSDWSPDRAIPLELKTSAAPGRTPCTYQGLSTTSQVFVRYSAVNSERRTGPCTPDDEAEHYELGPDPFELRNRFPAPPGTADARKERELEARTSDLSDCSGIRGRDPEPASGHYCE